eukprot:3215458-Amphidinium_carterae.1
MAKLASRSYGHTPLTCYESEGRWLVWAATVATSSQNSGIRVLTTDYCLDDSQTRIVQLLHQAG